MTSPARAASRPVIAAPRAAPLTRSALSWSLYEGGRDPYVIIIGKYVFVPYFATVVVGDAVRGQSLVALYTLVASLLVAFTAPLLGATVDSMGGRRRWLFGFTCAVVPLIAMLWFVKPGIGSSGLLAATLLLGAISVLLSYSDVMHNSMLLGAAAPDERSRASGLALSLGNGIATVMLLVVLGAFVLPGRGMVSWLPAHPLFGLDPAAFEPNRVVGPIVAAALAIGAAPILLFSRDTAPTGLRLGESFRAGVRELVSLVRDARLPPNVALYLVGRMLLMNGKMAILIFGGIYAAGVMGWTALDLMLMGLIIAPVGILGGAAGAWLDQWLGPKAAFITENAIAIVALMVQISMSPTAVFFVFKIDPDAVLWAGTPFNTAPDLFYLSAALTSQVFGTAAFSSGRTLMARLTPPEEAGAYFGLFALSASATMWVLPLLVDVFTRGFHSQQAGFTPIVAMMLAGLVLLLFVKGGGRPVST